MLRNYLKQPFIEVVSDNILNMLKKVSQLFLVTSNNLILRMKNISLFIGIIDFIIYNNQG